MGSESRSRDRKGALPATKGALKRLSESITKEGTAREGRCIAACNRCHVRHMSGSRADNAEHQAEVSSALQITLYSIFVPSMRKVREKFTIGNSYFSAVSVISLHISPLTISHSSSSILSVFSIPYNASSHTLSTFPILFSQCFHYSLFF